MDTLLVALRVALSLAVVVGLLWVLQRRMQKGTRRGPKASLVSVVGRQGLGQKASVVVVDVEGRRFVLGVTEQSVTVLHDALSPAESFATTLHAADTDTDTRRSAGIAATTATGAYKAAASVAAEDETLPAPLTFRPRHDRGTRAAESALRAESGPGSSSRPNRLAGSILSPATWQQTAAALRQGR
ncbi:flagellar biosynthetic protein FliO [Cryobacterium sp. MDB1-18-2]|uniref:flagellar biosynthetic protein FliO n=1 Tax=unclassified Cryobacterium TaxID=2649013 RepID=UPI00106CD8E5|nr:MULTISPECIES: flagellar biosynthetic protein FliO [unclassified Cryobacterium]TFC25004.1 flagellar biosynthetic protein FliO [Cryobacterium sp. MDB1-18-2]TFC45770.1 flagellar biosynthetic protein FliO [Cryobacterium sp. MDB1-18-1]